MSAGGGCPGGAEGKLVQIWRRSRPWLSLWESWRAISELERVYAIANMGKVRRLLLMYPLGHDYHPLSTSGVGLLPGSQSQIASRCIPALSVTAFSRASSPKGRAKGRAMPARLFSHRENNIGAMRRQCGAMYKYTQAAQMLMYRGF